MVRPWTFTMEEFEHLEEQERSVSHVDELAPELRQMALRQLEDDAGPVYAALIIEDGAIALGPNLSQIRRPLGTSGLVGAVVIVDQESVRSLLSEQAGTRAVRWFDDLVDAAPDRLPVVSFLKHGFRIASIALPRP